MPARLSGIIITTLVMKSLRIFLLLLLTFVIGTSAADARRDRRQQRVRVACIGNSITFGTGTENPATDSYPAQLKSMVDTTRFDIRKFGRPGATLLEKGHNPYVATDEHAAAVAFAPDVAVIHLGINDTDPRNWPNYNDEFVADYLKLIARLKEANPGVRVIIANLTPIRARHPRFKSGTRLWRDKIRNTIVDIARISGAELIDFQYPLIDRQDLLVDGLHPVKEGLALMAAKVAGVLTGDNGGLKVGPLYTDGMVLQRHRDIPVCGTADPGARITATLGPCSATATADAAGEWSLRLPPMPAATGLRMTITDGATTLAFDNVAVGEVWVASGQSNMAFMLREAVGGNEEAARSADPLLRFFDLKPRYITDSRQWSDSALAEVNALRYYAPARWREASPATSADMSAVAYWFARSLRDSLDGVPVGVILNAVGGAGAESYISPELLMEHMPEVMLDWRNNDYLQPWVRKRAGENAPAKANPLQRHPYEPTYLYSAGVRPLEGYGVEGVIWYQGESNAHNIEVHEQLFPLVVESYRRAFDNPRMPFYFVQLSSINRPSWPEFRDSQRRLAGSVAGTAMAVSSDLGDSLDVHPRHKQPVGERLGRIALNRIYGFSTEDSGPVATAATLCSDGSVVVDFSHAEGLTTSDNHAPATFELAEVDGLFFPAEAAIEGTAVRLRSDAVATPRYVRYGWQPFTRANLINNSKIPTSTFKMNITDNGLKATLIPVAATPEAEKGIEKGVSAMYGASLKAGIVVAGGCNFPVDDPISCPASAKQYYKGIYLLNPADAKSTWKKVGELPEAAGYGATFVSENEMVIIGGTTASGFLSDVIKVVFPEKGGKPAVVKAGELPFSMDNCGFCSTKHTGYIVGGNIDGKPSNRVIVYDLATGAFSDLPPMPGNPRVQPTAAIADGRLYVWGGFAGKHDGKEATLELGGLVYDFTSGKWSEVAGPVDAAGEPLSVGGGCSAPMADGRVMVCGGVNKDIFLEALRNQAPDYLQHPVEWYSFNPWILVFDPATESWSNLGATPDCARAGAILLPFGTEGEILFGGELKPRVRTPQAVVIKY